MRKRTAESGFTLIELMIASLVTMLLMGVAFSTFRDAEALHEGVVNLADSTQNLRAGTNLLLRDLLQAGRNIPIGGIAIPSGAGALPIQRPSPPGTSLQFLVNDESTTLTAITTGDGRGPTIAGKRTDLITILMDDPFLDEQKLYPYNAPLSRARLSIDGTSFDVGPHMHWIVGDKDRNIAPLKKGDVVYFNSNGGSGGESGNTLQTVTRITDSTVYFEPNDPFRFNQPGAPAGSITPIIPPPCSPAGSSTCESGMTIRRVFLYTYFVHADEETHIPRLMRMTNQFTPQALAGVIEDLELSYDLVDGDENPTNVADLPFTTTVDNVPVTYKANQIRKVNVHVGVRSEARASRANDYLRNHLSTVISLRNLAYVDRYITQTEE